MQSDLGDKGGRELPEFNTRGEVDFFDKAVEYTAEGGQKHIYKRSDVIAYLRAQGQSVGLFDWFTFFITEETLARRLNESLKGRVTAGTGEQTTVQKRAQAAAGRAGIDLTPLTPAEAEQSRKAAAHAKLQAAQRKELSALGDLSKLVRHFDAGKVKREYSVRTQEETYLDKRLGELERQIASKKQSPGSHDFEFRLLESEKEHVKAQVDACEKAKDWLARIDNSNTYTQQKIDEANQTTDQLLGKVHKHLQGRGNDLRGKLTEAEAKDINALWASLPNPPSEDIGEYFAGVRKLMVRVHEIEIRLMSGISEREALDNHVAEGRGRAESLSGIRDHTQTTYDQLSVDQLSVWQELGSLVPFEERQRLRQEGLARDLMTLSLEKKPECQLLLKLAKEHKEHKDRVGLQASKLSARYALGEAATATLKSIQDAHLKQFQEKLYPVQEFVSDVEQGEKIEALAPLRDKELVRKFDPKQLADGIKLKSNMEAWWTSLQRAWVNHLPRVQEEAILKIPEGAERLKKMEECFKEWVLQQTGMKFEASPLYTLSFDQIKIESHHERRVQATEKLKRSKGVVRVADAARSRLSASPRVQAAGSAERGLPLSAVEQTIEIREPQLSPPEKAAFVRNTGRVSNDHAINSLKAITKRIRSEGGSLYEQNCKLIKELATNPQLMQLQERHLYIRQECMLAAANAKDEKKVVDSDIQKIFLDQYRNDSKELDLTRLDNSGREQLLRTFLEMSGCDRVPIFRVRTEAERNHLVQFASLSHMILPDIEVVPGALPNPLLNELGRALQASPISLEGLEESTIQRSFQDRNIPETVEVRAYIDALRARHGVSNLPETLLPHVEAYYPIGHDQGQEGLGRAYSAVMKSKKPAEKVAFFQQKLASHLDPVNTLADPQTLALPPRIFLLDCLLREVPENKEAAEEVAAFNKNLILSNNVSERLMGFAREITRLSAKAPESPAELAKLLKMKIAYQSLQQDYFKGKQEIVGFLKTATEAAETAMMQNLASMGPVIRGTDLKELRAELQKPLFPPDKTSADKIADKAFNPKNKSSLTVDPATPHFITLGNVDVDAAFGVVYHDGQQQVWMPSRLQNHPDVRSLGLHQFPYMLDSEGAFCYRAEENGQKVPQVRITEKDGAPVIQRRLPTGFGGSPAKAELQFVSKETLNSLPYSVAHRMGIQNFWQDDKGNLYGYNKEGGLVAKLSPIQPGLIDRTFRKIPPQEWAVSVENRDPATQAKAPLLNYRFLNKGKQVDPGKELFTKLSSCCVNLDEILTGEDSKSFWIPSLDLHMRRDKDAAGQPVWKCEGQGVSGMILDLENSGEARLVFKRAEASPKAAEIQRKLAGVRKSQKDVEAEEQAKSPSLRTKSRAAKLTREELKLEEELAQLEGRLCLAVLSEKAPEEVPEQVPEQDIDKLFQKDPKKVSAQEYKIALRFFRQQMGMLSHEIAETTDSAASKKLQEDYLELEQKYNSYKTQSEALYDRPADRLLFEITTPSAREEALLASRDLEGAAFLVLRGVEMDPSADPLKLMQELSNNPFTRPLSPHTLELLQEAEAAVIEKAGANEGLKPLQLYLNLLVLQHFTYEMEELAHSKLAGKEDKLALVQKNYREQKETCKKLSEEVQKLPPNAIPLTLRTLILTAEPGDIPQPPSPAGGARGTPPEILEREVKALAQQSLLERLAGAESITSTRKEIAKELSNEHRALIENFAGHSPDQVNGFYLEEMGHFTEKELMDEFRVRGGKGLFGMQEKDIKDIFAYLKSKKWITQSDNGLWAIAPGKDPLTLFQETEIRALLAGRPLSEAGITKITERLRVFFSKAGQASFTFAFKTPEAEKALDKRLEAEKALHFEKMLDAENFLTVGLSRSGISLVELKAAVLSGDRSKLIALGDGEYKGLRTALMRYLFHKTEFQHIENIQKAPKVGERNKIELLNAKREYPIDLLFREGLTGREREEQIMQMAFLAFEEDYGYRCNAMQIKMFRSLLLDSGHEEAIDAAQARMGFGKTALLPLMALVRVAIERNATTEREDRHLVRYVVPRAVIEDNTRAFNQRMSSILGANVVKDREFTRYQIDTSTPENTRKSFELALEDLDRRLSFYKEVRNQGSVLIQWPEIRGSMESQELDFGEMIAKGDMTDEVLALCIECKKRLGEIRSLATYTVYDELDDTQDVKSREVNYTRGAKTPIDVSSIRPLEKLIALLAKEKDVSYLPALAGRMLEAAGFSQAEITSELIEYLTNRNKSLKGPPDVSGVLSRQQPPTEKDSSLFLIRALLIDPNILALAKSKQPSTHFGARFTEQAGRRVYSQDPDSGSAFLIAVPYEGVNTPKGLSIFDNTEVAAITTIRYYNSPETLLEQDPHLNFLIEQTRRDKIPGELKEYVKDLKNGEGKSMLEQLQKLTTMLDQEEIKTARAAFYNDFMRTPDPRFRQYFGAAVVATQVRSDAASAKSNRYENGSRRDISKGCSGTVGGTSSYFDVAETDPAADGKLSIEIMGRANNAAVKLLDPPKEGQDYLKQILSTLLRNANPDTRAIVDAAGMCKSRDGTPESVVVELWSQLKADSRFSGIEGIVYYGKDNVKRLYTGSFPAKECNTAMELEALPGKKYFSFYGQKNTRGSDIKQADGAHELVTMDENVTNSDAKQAILRFRSLVNRDSGQTFSFAVMKGSDYAAGLSKAAGAEGIRARHVAVDLRTREKATEVKDSLTIFRKEMEAHVKQAAARLEHSILAQVKGNLLPAQQAAYKEFLEKRSKIVSFVENSIDSLEAKYGAATADQDKEVFIQAQRALADDKLQGLFRLTKAFAEEIGGGVKAPIQEEEEEHCKQQLDKSVELFQKRYTEKTVQVSVVDSGAQAVAQALAEAQAMAEAQAEALAENLAENVVDVLPRLEVPGIQMTERKHIRANLDFLSRAAEKCMGVKEFEPMQRLIRPNLRSDFLVSPHLESSQPLVSHFILQSTEDIIGDHFFIFISQEEADLFQKEAKGGGVYMGFKLHDARGDLDGILGEYQNQIRAAILGDNGAGRAVSEATDTSALRDVQLTNVTTEQLLPTLQLEGQAGMATLQEYVDLSVFGVSREDPLTLEIDPTDKKEIKIDFQPPGAAPIHVSVPKGNWLLDELIPGVFGDEGIQGKVAEVGRRVEERAAELERKKQEIEAMKAELEAQERQIGDAARSIKGFNAADHTAQVYDPYTGRMETVTLKGGLEGRDGEEKTDVDGRVTYKFETCAPAFLGALPAIEKARLAFAAQPTKENAEALQRAFDGFILRDTVEKACREGFDIEHEKLITDGTWEGPDKKPFERVYGRILYKAHGGSVEGAFGCSRPDCACMFKTTLPALIDTIKSLKNAMSTIEEIEARKQELAARMAEINKKLAEFEVARTWVRETLASQTKAEGALETQGMRLAEKGQLFDRFKLGNFQQWQKPAGGTLRGQLPQYKDVVGKDMAQYRKNIHALSQPERDVTQQNQAFLNRVLTLAARPERRPELVNRLRQPDRPGYRQDLRS